MKENNPTAALARFVAGVRTEDIPTAVADRVKLLLADAVASGLTGWTSAETSIIEVSARSSFGPGKSPVIGGTPLSPGAAAMVNGYLITARSLCDMYQPTLCHVTPVVVPPVLAVAIESQASGPDVLAGLAMGFEATVRIGQSLDYTEFRSRGWHTTGVVGPIGGAIGAARVARLDPERTERAIGLAAAHSAGTFAAFGTPTIKFNQARAALGGYMAVDLARVGFLGPTDVLTAADGGLLGTYSHGGDPDLITDSLGDRWELLGITTRLWPAAAALQGVMTIIAGDDVPDVDDISSVTIGLPPANFRMNAEMPWDTPFQAQLSARFITSVALHDRAVWLEQFAPERLQEAALSDFARERVTVLEDPSLPESGVSMELETKSGARREWRRPRPKGHPDDPTGWGDIGNKLRMAAKGVLDDESAVRLLELIRRLESVDGVGALADLLRRPG